MWDRPGASYGRSMTARSITDHHRPGDGRPARRRLPPLLLRLRRRRRTLRRRRLLRPAAPDVALPAPGTGRRRSPRQLRSIAEGPVDIDVVRTIPTATGFVTEHVETQHTPDRRDDRPAPPPVRGATTAASRAVTTYCNGGWDDELRARHAAEAPMIRPDDRDDRPCSYRHVHRNRRRELRALLRTRPSPPPCPCRCSRPPTCSPGERVLDVACGTGLIARLAAALRRPAAPSPGIDLAPDMIDVARAATDPGRAIDWHVG